jgi:hypothetical protein
MASETVVGLYSNLDSANDAVRELVAAGFNRDNISLVARDAAGVYTREVGDEDVKGGDGAGFGALIGGLTGIVVGLSAIIVPGVGPIIAAGPVAALLGGTAGAAVGAVAGAVTGGLTASLINLGVPEEYAEYYTESVRRGGALVSVMAEGDDITDAMNILQRHHPVDVKRRAESWREAGWQGFDPEAEPYTEAELERERQMYGEEALPDEEDDIVRRYPPLPPVR